VESNWRLNVWRLGLDPTETRFAAPYLANPTIYLCERYVGFRTQFRYAANYGGDRGYQIYFEDWDPNMPTHFPYGIGVYPDQPT
jgi:hypothetical protein